MSDPAECEFCGVVLREHEREHKGRGQSCDTCFGISEGRRQERTRLQEAVRLLLRRAWDRNDQRGAYGMLDLLTGALDSFWRTGSFADQRGCATDRSLTPGDAPPRKEET